MSRTLLIALVATTVLAVLVPAGPVAADSVSVGLRVGPSGFVVPSHWAVGNPSVWIIDPAVVTVFNDAPGIAGCEVQASDGNNDGRVDGTEVLGAATGSCISGWSGEDQGFGIFVTSVDGLDAVGWPVAYWYLQVNGMSSPVGVSDMSLGNGDWLDVVYFGGPL